MSERENEGFSTGLVSAIVASYNHAEFLRQRMDSLLAQTYESLEIIVIDDCSTDDSREVLKDYEGCPRVRLHPRKQNGGWVVVSNEGVSLARGEFVLFANCDDYCDPRQVERLVAAARTYPQVGIVFSRSDMVDEAGVRLGSDFDYRDKEFQSHCRQDAVIPRPLAARFLMHSCVIPNLSAALFRRSSLGGADPLSGAFRVCADWDLFFRVAQTNDIYYITEALNSFRQHETTIRSTTKDRVIYEEMFRLLYGQMGLWNFTGEEREAFKSRIAQLWATYILGHSLNGVRNFGFLLKEARKYEQSPLRYLAKGMILRVDELSRSMLRRKVRE